MIRVGIIGLGRSGWELHAETLHRMPGYVVSAVCDLSPALLSRAAERFEARTFAEAETLIQNAELDLVVVAVPGNLHAPLAISALEAGKNAVVEKPMSSTLAEADHMLAAAERAGRRLAVFHNRHWDPDYRMVKGLVERGALGDLLTIDSRIMSFGPEWTTYGVPEFEPSWRVQARYGGGFLADWGPHMVEQMLDLIAEWPERVDCQLRGYVWSEEVDDYFSMRLSYASGLLVRIEGSNNARIPPPRWFIQGREATLISGSGWTGWTDIRLRQTIGRMTADMAPQDIVQCDAPGDQGDGSSCFYADLQRMLLEDETPAVTAERGRDVMAILDAARESSTTGQAVRPEAPRSVHM